MLLRADLLVSLERHGIAQALQAAERAFDHMLLLPCLKKVGPEVTVGLLVAQHMVDDDRQAVSNRHWGTQFVRLGRVLLVLEK